MSRGITYLNDADFGRLAMCRGCGWRVKEAREHCSYIAYSTSQRSDTTKDRGWVGVSSPWGRTSRVPSSRSLRLCSCIPLSESCGDVIEAGSAMTKLERQSEMTKMYRSILVKQICPRWTAVNSTRLYSLAYDVTRYLWTHQNCNLHPFPFEGK